MMTLDAAFRDTLVLDFENDARCEEILDRLRTRVDIARVVELCRGDEHTDPLFAAAEEGRLQVLNGGLYLPGYDRPSASGIGEEYACDLLITPVRAGGWHLQYRDPEDEKDPLWGREWSDPARVYTSWHDLVAFAYSL